MGVMHQRTVGTGANRMFFFAQWKRVGTMVHECSVRSSANYANTKFSMAGIGRMKKIYCKCGCIIGMDSAQMKLKLQLGKELECADCRNARIAHDIDEMNRHFDGCDEEVY